MVNPKKIESQFQEMDEQFGRRTADMANHDALMRSLKINAGPPHPRATRPRPATVVVRQTSERVEPTFSQVERVPSSDDKAEGFGVIEESEMTRWMSKFSQNVTESFQSQLVAESNPNYQKTTLFGFCDVSPFIRSAIQCFAADSFTQCFESKRRERWNFTVYLLPLWLLGVIVRYGMYFQAPVFICLPNFSLYPLSLIVPLRVLILAIGFTIFTSIFLCALPFGPETRYRMNTFALWFLAKTFLISWCAVLREHGIIPPREPGQIYVANHTSVIDVVLLMNRCLFSLTGQQHTGLLGLFQKHVFGSMENLWFDRMASRDRALVAQKIKAHAADVTKPPLLVFPEGVCVNNEYVVMFKRGAFELGTSIVPVAIKYNKVFVDAFWNSRKQSFAKHMWSLICSWAVVADVYYMEPQYRQQGESATAFATRVKDMIAKRADLQSVPWDGYLKYFKPKPEIKIAQQKVYAKVLLQRFGPAIKEWRDSKQPAASKNLLSKFPNTEGRLNRAILLPPTRYDRNDDENSDRNTWVARRRITSDSFLPR